jgi:dihydroxycyclohexadiene carboxylate dehydrogenase
VVKDRTELDQRAAGAQRLMGRVCIVTGSGQGIGRATARRLAAEGARMVIADRIAETADATVEELQTHGVEAVASYSDVSSYAGASLVMQCALDTFGCVNVLVNSVGGTIWWKRFHQYTEEEILLELERSLYTTLWCSRAVLPIMIEQGGGAIVNVSSSVVEGGLFRTPYAISKGGVEAMTRTLASEYGSYGIRVNAVSPGSTTILDRVTSRLTLRPGVVAAPDPDSDVLVAEARGDLTKRALGRAGTPEEQAAAIAFLASDDSSYMTGQILHVSGNP